MTLKFDFFRKKYIIEKIDLFAVRIRASFIAFSFITIMLVFIFISLNIFGIAFRKMGVPPEYSVYFLFLSLPCSYLNIPIKKLKSYVPIMSVFLSTKVDLVEILPGILVMTIIIHKIARPVKGSGIAIHAFLPPFLAAFVAIIISPQNAPSIAYISGTFGCILGIDILNLNKIPDLGGAISFYRSSRDI